jgi:hypothetical protein
MLSDAAVRCRPKAGRGPENLWRRNLGHWQERWLGTTFAADEMPIELQSRSGAGKVN